MSYPQGYLYQPSASLALYSCPAYSTSVISGPRTDELGRSSSGSAFSPYAGSTAFTAPSPGYNSHLQYGTDPTAAFTSYVGSPYDHSTGMAGSIGYHPYAAPLGSYPYGDPAYRKNATRDATATLKAWLSEHRKNPYPTKGEKIMLAIITKMTLTQVSTWFANARRRLKKENKMTWSPRNKGGEDKNEGSEKKDEEYGADSMHKDEKEYRDDKELGLSDLDVLEDDDLGKLGSNQEKAPSEIGPRRSLVECEGSDCSVSPRSNQHNFSIPINHSTLRSDLPETRTDRTPVSVAESSLLQRFGTVDRPRIWSLAHTASSSPLAGCQSGQARTVRYCAEVRPTQGSVNQVDDIISLRDSSHAARILRTSALNLQTLVATGQLHCASYPALDNCQYTPGTEGFLRNVKSDSGSADISETCLLHQEGKVRTAFRAVLKR